MATAATAVVTPTAVSRRFSVDSFERFHDGDEGERNDSRGETSGFSTPGDAANISNFTRSTSFTNRIGRGPSSFRSTGARRVRIRLEEDGGHLSGDLSPSVTLPRIPPNVAAPSQRRTVSFAKQQPPSATKSPASALAPSDQPLSVRSGMTSSPSPCVTTLDTTPVITPFNAQASAWVGSPTTAGPASQPFAIMLNRAPAPANTPLADSQDAGLDLALLTPLNQRSLGLTNNSNGSSTADEGGSSATVQAAELCQQGPAARSPSSNKTRVNRWFVVCTCLVIASMTGSFLFNWPAAQTMLLKGGAYTWLCESNPSSIKRQLDNFPLSIGRPPPPPLSFKDFYPSTSRVLRALAAPPSSSTLKRNAAQASRITSGASGCMSQLQAVNSLMPLGVAAWFAFSLIGGLAVDTLGPRLTSVLGLVFSLSGWVLLGLSGESFSVYSLAIILINSGVDVVFIGLMSAANLFPNYRGTVVSSFNAARSLAFGIPFLFSYMHQFIPFGSACFLYASILFLWIGLICLVLPTTESSALPTLTPPPDASTSQSPSPPVKRALGVQSMTTTASTEQLSPSSHSGGGGLLMSPNEGPSLYTDDDTTQGSEKPGDNATDDDKNESVVSHRRRGKVRIPSRIRKICASSIRLKMVIEALRSRKYYPLVPMAMLTVLRGGFLSNSAVDQLGSRVHLFALLTPLSCLPAPFFGFLADLVSIYFVFILHNTFALLQFILLLTNHLNANNEISLTVVSVLNLLVSSFFLGQFYCYITVTFPPCITGTLVGLTISFSGLFGLLVTPMYNFSTNNSSFFEMNLVAVILILLCYLLIFVLYKARHDTLFRAQASHDEVKRGTTKEDQGVAPFS